MKYLFIIIAIVSLFSCNQDSKFNGNRISAAAITDNKEIIGQWGLYSTFGAGLTNLCNVCPTVLFIDDATGFITKPSGQIELFNWALKKNVLTVLYVNQIMDKTFSDSVYNITFSKQNNLLSLEIHEIKSDVTYFLSKQL